MGGGLKQTALAAPAPAVPMGGPQSCAPGAALGLWRSCSWLFCCCLNGFMGTDFTHRPHPLPGCAAQGFSTATASCGHCRCSQRRPPPPALSSPLSAFCLRGLASWGHFVGQESPHAWSQALLGAHRTQQEPHQEDTVALGRGAQTPPPRLLGNSLVAFHGAGRSLGVS